MQTSTQTRPAVGGRPRPPSPSIAHPVRRATEGNWKPWYDALIDFILTKPDAKIDEIAAYVGRKPGWCRLIMRSDAFQAQLAVRREAFQTTLTESISTRLHETALTALDILLEQLHKGRTNVPIARVMQAAELGLEKLGYGVPAPQPTAAVQVNIGASPEALLEAQSVLRELEDRRATGAANGSAVPANRPAGPAGTVLLDGEPAKRAAGAAGTVPFTNRPAGPEPASDTPLVPSLADL